MKLVSWNVNGLRACLNKGFLDFVALADADVICLQETKLQPHQVSFELPGYRMYFNSADTAGYSGTAVLTRKEPLNALFLHFPLLIFHDGLLVIGRRLPLHKGDGPGGAGGQAVAQTVAVVVPHELRLAVHHGDGALVTGGGAGAAAVALLLIDFNNPSFHCNAS